MLSFFLTHFPADHDYPFLPLSLVGSYQVGYTRSHPNTEVKMLRACSVPLCSHRRERQVIYLFVFLILTITIIDTHIQYDYTHTHDNTMLILYTLYRKSAYIPITIYWYKNYCNNYTDTHTGKIFIYPHSRLFIPTILCSYPPIFIYYPMYISLSLH